MRTHGQIGGPGSSRRVCTFSTAIPHVRAVCKTHSTFLSQWERRLGLIHIFRFLQRAWISQYSARLAQTPFGFLWRSRVFWARGPITGIEADADIHCTYKFFATYVHNASYRPYLYWAGSQWE